MDNTEKQNKKKLLMWLKYLRQCIQYIVVQTNYIDIYFNVKKGADV